MELVVRDHAPIETRIVTAATKPKGAKGTGKPKKAPKHQHSAGLPAGTVLTFVDGTIIGTVPAAPKPRKTTTGQVSKPKKAAASGAKPKPKKATSSGVKVTAIGPGKVVGVSCNGKELFAEITFAESFSIADGCIHVDGHVIHKSKASDKLSVGTMMAARVMNIF